MLLIQGCFYDKTFVQGISIFHPSMKVWYEFHIVIKRDYGIKPQSISTRNPQANVILESIHQTIGNIIRTFELHEADVEEDLWPGVLGVAAFAVRSTYHTTLQKTPGQLVFGRDMIFNLQHIANWEYICQREQGLDKTKQL